MTLYCLSCGPHRLPTSLFYIISLKHNILSSLLPNNTAKSTYVMTSFIWVFVSMLNGLRGSVLSWLEHLRVFLYLQTLVATRDNHSWAVREIVVQCFLIIIWSRCGGRGKGSIRIVSCRPLWDIVLSHTYPTLLVRLTNSDHLYITIKSKLLVQDIRIVSLHIWIYLVSRFLWRAITILLSLIGIIFEYGQVRPWHRELLHKLELFFIGLIIIHCKLGF